MAKEKKLSKRKIKTAALNNVIANLKEASPVEPQISNHSTVDVHGGSVAGSVHVTISINRDESNVHFNQLLTELLIDVLGKASTNATKFFGLPSKLSVEQSLNPFGEPSESEGE